MKRKIIIFTSSILGILFIIFGIFFIYVGNYYHADSDALNECISTNLVEYNETSNYISFIPKDKEYDYSIVFYQGAKVEVKAYAPLLKTLAENNVAVYGIKCKFNFAFFNVDDFNKIYSNVNNGTRFYVMGHSLGGVMAGSAAKKYSDKCEGIILLASYLSSDISDTDLKVLSIYGSNDTVLKIDKYNDAKKYLPKSFIEHRINGGIHSYFASYGNQKGDGEATIIREEQINLTKNYILTFLGL